MANYDVESHIPGTEKCFYFYFWHPTHARTTRYEEAFLPEGKNTASIASLPRPCLIISTTQKGIYTLSSSRWREEMRSTHEVPRRTRRITTYSRSSQKHLHRSVPSGNSQIDLHIYRDTEYESILNSPPALSLVNVVTKHHPFGSSVLLYRIVLRSPAAFASRPSQ